MHYIYNKNMVKRAQFCPTIIIASHSILRPDLIHRQEMLCTKRRLDLVAMGVASNFLPILLLKDLQLFTKLSVPKEEGNRFSRIRW